jgi:hypothetical protein
MQRSFDENPVANWAAPNVGVVGERLQAFR